MRGLVVGITVPVALVVELLCVVLDHFAGPDTTDPQALAEPVFAGAPLAAFGEDPGGLT
ncbi:MAG: hypothetical protein ABSC13_02620 [Dehalococcoidia bacterium]